MTHAMPLPLPAALVDHHAIDLERLYSSGWGLKAVDVATTPSGEIYALYSVHRYTYGVADEETEPAKAHFGYRLLARFAPDGVPLALAVTGESDYYSHKASFCGAHHRPGQPTCTEPKGCASCPTDLWQPQRPPTAPT